MRKRIEVGTASTGWHVPLGKAVVGMPAVLWYHAGMSKQLTIRGVPDEVAERLTALSNSQGRSVNSTVLEILARAVGVEERRQWLERYATWTAADLAEFDEALAAQRRVDDELWG